MIGVVAGKVVKSGSGRRGFWLLVEEPAFASRSGQTVRPRVMCVGETLIEEGTYVVAQGLARATLTERDGKSYANMTLDRCRYTIIDERVATPDVCGVTDDVPF